MKNAKPWVIHKFGGTSVAGAEQYRRVTKIIEADAKAQPRQAVVVSAMSGVTDRLHELLDLAKARDARQAEKLTELKQKHLLVVTELFAGKPGPHAQAITRAIELDCSQIQDLLKAVWLSRSFSEQTLELVVGHGEVWSAQILGGYLQALGLSAEWLDARQVLVVTPGEAGPVIDWDVSGGKLQAKLEANPVPLLVITGYVASTPDGVATTLKRNGSDFSASIFGKLLDVSCITIWTDVDGVLSADPRRVPEAVVLDEMSYQEAMELTYFGAKVIHPHTMAPALEKNIPILIRNTFNPSAPGTKIHHVKPRPGDEHPIKGFTTVDKISLVNVEGTGMIGVPGVASRLFGALREVGVSVIMISQASSEHSICFAVPAHQGAQAKAAAEKAFYREIQEGRIQSVEQVEDCSILAAVGDSMVEATGVAGKFFQALAKASINVRAIAQGSSERNISVVINQADATRALRAAHAGFYLSAQTLSVGVIGPGSIGTVLLKQLQQQAEYLRNKFKIDLRVRGIMNSRKMLLDEQAISLGNWKERLAEKGVAPDLGAFIKHVHSGVLPHAVIIDCTSSEEVAGHYADWLSRGIHVITPNKKAGSGPFAAYRKIRGLGAEVGSHYLYEATVGAGLPVITTLRDLIRTGDQIIRIEGVLSGTLSYIFNTFSKDVSFSSVVREAQKAGYTEPDPRDDLSGMDVARKLIILGREMGLDLELSDIRVQSLVPAELAGKNVSADEYLRRVSEHDAEMAKLQAEAAAHDEVLRYVGVVSPGGKPTVELKRYPKTHAFARTQATDNIIAFTTSRYSKQPLVVQGPGAGPEVTAGGVFSDLLRLAAYVGAPT